MRRSYVFAICLVVLGLTACTQADNERAQQKADEAKRETQRGAERVKEDARKLGSEAKQEAQKLDRQFGQAIDGNAPARNSSGGVRIDTTQAGVKLDQAAVIAKVKARLLSDAGLGTAVAVDIDAHGDTVTLRGTVSSQEKKQEAEEAAKQVSGVAQVINDLRIEP